MNTEMIHVRPRHDDPIHAVQVTADNILDLAARFSGTVVTMPTPANVAAIAGWKPPRSEAILFALEQRYNLQDRAMVGDWIVKHPGTLRTIEILNADRFARAYEATALADTPASLDEAVAAEVAPRELTGYVLVAEVTEGGLFTIRSGISPAHAVGILDIAHVNARGATQR